MEGMPIAATLRGTVSGLARESGRRAPAIVFAYKAGEEE
jgi:hypothetical protein